MGSSSSKAHSREPPVSWRAAIRRRLQIWEELKPYLIRVIKFVGPGGSAVIASLPTPKPQIYAGATNGQVEVVSVVEMLLVEALQRSADNKDADGQPAKQMTNHQGEDEPDQVKDSSQDNFTPSSRKEDQDGSDRVPTGESKAEATLVQAIRALQKRLVADVKDVKDANPGAGSDDKDDGHNDGALVAHFVRSSLDIALPRIEERGSDGQATLAQSALSYSLASRSIVLEDTTSSPLLAPNARSSPPATSYPSVLPPAVLPAIVQEELNTKLGNYLTWDKKLYANLRLDPESIRLVEIRPGSSPQIEVDLIKRPLDEVKNAYEALSYTWGSPSPKETIVVNGVRVQINQWLFGALSSLRLPNTKRCLWVDAICINQANIAERSIEVQKMGDIYRLAKTVVIFHGWPSTTTREGSLITALFKFLARSDHSGTSNAESVQTNGSVDDPFRSCGLDKALVCKGFIDFCCRPWWRRVWTMQEFYLATEEPVWYWGSTGVSNTLLKRDMPLLMTASWDLYGQKEIESWLPKHIETATGKPVAQFSNEIRRISDLISRRNKTHGFDIPSRLYRSLSAQATDPHDLVYGLREIFDPVFRGVFVPDYFMQLELLYACLAVFLIQFEGWEICCGGTRTAFSPKDFQAGYQTSQSAWCRPRQNYYLETISQQALFN